MPIKPPCTSASRIIITEDMLAPRPRPSPTVAAPARRAHAIPPAEVKAIFVRLRALKRSFGSKPNLNELAQSLVAACILEGFNTRPQIVGALTRLDIKQAQVIIILNLFDGGSWRCDRDGVYHLLDGATADQ